MLDAHHHLWRIGQHGCIWPTADLTPIYRDYDLVDLRQVTGHSGITGTVLVQSQPCDEDTDFLLSVASANDLIHAVVGWVDLLAPTAPDRIARLAGNEKLRGIRPMVQSLPDGWLANTALDPAIEAMTDHGLTFDALVYTRHLADLGRFAKRYPTLDIVIDHGAKPPIASGLIGHWREAIAAIAALPNVYCKLSGLPTEAGAQGEDMLLACMEHLVTSFGAPRLMWGSDWPVLELAGDYDGWLSLARSFVGNFAPAGAQEIFEGTARRFYRIGSGCSDKA